MPFDSRPAGMRLLWALCLLNQALAAGADDGPTANAARTAAISADARDAPNRASSRAPAVPLEGMELEGRWYRLEGLGHCPAVVLVFLDIDGPASAAALPRLNRLVTEFAGDGVEIYGVISDRGTTRAAAVQYRDRHPLGFPLLFDAAGEICARLGATHTPQAFVLAPGGRVVYSGKIDDVGEPPPAGQKPRAGRSFVGEAVRALLNQNDRAPTATTPVGRPLAEGSRGPGADQVNYTRDIAPLIQHQCVDCHRAGAAAPFELIAYHQVARRAGQIAALTARRQMPPWKPVAGFGAFRHERRLSDRQIGLLAAWARAGAPEGDPADLPPPPQFSDGWQLGRPHLVFRAPEPFDIPADGPDIYRYFVFPTGVDSDRLASAIEFRADTPRSVHHATIFLDRSGAARRLDAADPGPGYSRSGSMGFAVSGGLGGWGPGATPQRLPLGMGRLISQGADLVVQVHYHPSGKPERDQPMVGVYFAPPGAQQLVGEVLVANRKLEIPAGAAQHRHNAAYVLPVDTILLDVTPHMHYLGRELRATATWPDGHVEPLVWIRDWDFNWHDHYTFARPLKLPKGTRIDVAAVYDNSPSNPRNPHTPPQTVYWGEQSTEEMGACFFQATTESGGDFATLLEDNGRYIADQDPLPPSPPEEVARDRAAPGG